MASITYDPLTTVVLVLSQKLAGKLFKAMELPMIMPLDTMDKDRIRREIQKGMAR